MPPPRHERERDRALSAPGRRLALTRALRTGLAAPLLALRRTARDPRLVRLQLAWASVMVASWVATVTLTVVAFGEGGSRAVSLVVLARTVPGLAAGPVAGALVDRFPRRGCLLVAAGASAVSTAVAAVAAGSLVLLTVLVTAVGLSTLLFRTAQSAVLPELAEDTEELTAANVLSSAVEALGLFAGPALAALLLALQGPQLSLAVAAALLAAATVLLLGLPRGASPSQSTGEPGPRGGLRDLLRLPAARLVLLLLVAQTVLSGGLSVLYPALAVDVLDLDASAVGLLAAAFGVGGVLGSVGLFALAGSRRLGLLSAVGLLLWSVPLLLLPLLPQVGPVLLLLAVVGAGNVLFDVTSVTLLQRAVPARLLGRAFGAVETAAALGLAAGAGVVPLLQALSGASGALALLALALALVSVLAVRALRRLDRDLDAPVRQVALLRAVPAFALLPVQQLEQLALALQRSEVEAGTAVTRQGEPGRTWCLLDEGLLQVEVDGRPVRVLEPGDAFGEIALLREGVRTASVVALQRCVVWTLDGEVFLAALRSDGGRALDALDDVASRNLARAAPSLPAGWAPPS